MNTEKLLLYKRNLRRNATFFRRFGISAINSRCCSFSVLSTLFIIFTRKNVFLELAPNCFVGAHNLVIIPLFKSLNFPQKNHNFRNDEQQQCVYLVPILISSINLSMLTKKIMVWKNPRKTTKLGIAENWVYVTIFGDKWV
jgi:hypothetical protein